MHNAARLTVEAGQPIASSTWCRASKARPHSIIAAIAAAGVLTRLVSRFELRTPPTSPSAPAASVAAGAPYRASSPNTSTSATPIEYLVRGMCTGKNAASTTQPMPSCTWASSTQGRATSRDAAQTIASRPEAASASHRRVAAVL